MKFSPQERNAILQKAFSDECIIIGSKNLNKICQDNRPDLAQTKLGSNMMLGDLIILLLESLSFIDTALSVWEKLFKEEKERTSENIYNITIQEIKIENINIPEEKQLELSELVVKHAEKQLYNG